MDLPDAFLSLATMATGAFGAPFHDGAILSQGTPGTYDDDGNFVPGSAAGERACKVQIDALSEQNRPEGWTDKDYRFIILRASFEGDLDTDASVKIASGPRAGTWLVSALELDAAAIGFVGKGRQA